MTKIALSGLCIASFAIAFVGCNSSTDSNATGTFATSTTGGETTDTATTGATTGTQSPEGTGGTSAGSPSGSAGSASGGTTPPTNGGATGTPGTTGSKEASPSPNGNGPSTTSMNPPKASSKAPSTQKSSGTGHTQANLIAFGAVQPILTSNCYCHLSENPPGGLHLSSYEGVMKGASMGAVVKPGDAKNSMLSWAINHTHGVTPMPKGQPKLSAADIKTIDTWINQGAKK